MKVTKKRPREYNMPETYKETQEKIKMICKKIYEREMILKKTEIPFLWEIKRRLLAHINTF